jgi:hypothetical protein
LKRTDTFQKKYNWAGIPRWRLEGGSRKCAYYSEILEKCWRHTLQARPPRRGKTLTPSTPPACAENLHFTLNGETRKAPGRPVAHAQTAWEDADKMSKWYVVLPHTTLGQISIAPWTDRLHPGKKEKLRNKQKEQ